MAARTGHRQTQERLGRDIYLVGPGVGWLNLRRFCTGLPWAIFYYGIWPANFSFFSFGAVAYLINPSFTTSNGYDSNGNPGVFSNTAAASSNWLPIEVHRPQLRGKAFSAFNHANFTNPNLDASSSSTFSEYTDYAGCRLPVVSG